MAGDAETGVMVMRMDEGLDTGPVLMAERTPVARKTYGELHDELARLGADLMARAMSAVALGQASETPQPEDGATYAKKILKEEARIDWTKPAHELDCLIRGLSPFPGAWCEWKGERLKVLFADPVDGKGAPGEALDDKLTIACGEGALHIRSLQRPGKSAMAAEDMLRGYAVPKGTMLS
jgi:methionyl-tRNA formyltransferase